MEASLLKQGIFAWGLALLLGLPILVLILGEITERLKQRHNPLAQWVQQTRHLVLPLFAALLIMRFILGVAGSDTSVQTVATLFWIAFGYSLLTLMRTLVELGTIDPTSRVVKIPTLLFALARAAVLSVVIYHILAGVWGIDLSQMGKVVGFGSLALALALQDTIGNTVSGFLMMADRPFRVNDWVQVGGEWLTVKEMTWRTTRLENFVDKGMVVIPNGVLANEKIINYGQEGAVIQILVFFIFSYDDPPNLVKRVLADVVKPIPGVMPDPPPQIVTHGYEDYGIRYRLKCTIDFWIYGSVWDALHTKLYYAAKRNGLTLSRQSRQIEFQGSINDLKPAIVPQQIAAMLRSNPLFESLDAETIDWLATGATLHDYAAGDTMLEQGGPDEGFYIIETGEVTIGVQSGTERTQEIARLKSGEFFGEMTLIRHEPSPISAVAVSDVRLLICEGEMIAQIIETNPKFALELNFFIEKRQTAVGVITGTEKGLHAPTANRDWTDIVRNL